MKICHYCWKLFLLYFMFYMTSKEDMKLKSLTANSSEDVASLGFQGCKLCTILYKCLFQKLESYIFPYLGSKIMPSVYNQIFVFFELSRITVTLWIVLRKIIHRQVSLIKQFIWTHFDAHQNYIPVTTRWKLDRHNTNKFIWNPECHKGV